MNINFRKITALAASTLMVGMTMGIAAAANYPAPFVSGGAADVAIVYGTGQGVSFLDGLEAGNLQTDLQRFLSGGTGGTGASVTGETVSLGTGSTKIWLNTSLNVAKTQLTKTDLPTVLADYTFSGNVDSKLTYTIKPGAGAAAGDDNSGKVIFAKQPSSSSDPKISISMGTSKARILYNASATMSAINFTHADSEGEEVMLFGQKFTVASATSLTELVLLKEAEKLSLDSDNPSATVTIGGATYTVELVSASDTTANIKVTDSAGTSDNREISEAASKKVNGVTIAVQNADETNLKLSATIIAGAEKITLAAGSSVTTGDSGTSIDGTSVYITGGTNATTEIAIAVFAPSTSNDAILSGESFVDPVFGSFKVDFTGLSSSLTDTNRDTIIVDNAGVKDLQLTLTDQGGNKKNFDFAHNQSNMLFLGDNSNYSIGAREMANLSYGTSGRKYIVVGNEDYGHILELRKIHNATTGANSVSDDDVEFIDVIDGTTTYLTSFVSTEGSGTLDVDGKRYTVTFGGDSDTGWAQVKYPASEDDGSHSAGDIVVYPTIETQRGALVALYEPLTIDLGSVDGSGTDATKLVFPDGDGYTSITLEYEVITGTDNIWNVTGGGVTDEQLNTTVADFVDFTIGQLVFNLTRTAANTTKLFVTDPEGTANMENVGLIIFEGKGDTTTNDYRAIFVDVERGAAGTSTNPLGVNDILFDSPTHWEAVQNTDSDITEHLDLYGTHAMYDTNTASQGKVTMTIPPGQVYADVYIGEDTSVVAPGTTGTTGSTTSIGSVLVKDTEVSSVGTKNLIVVGGSCINSAAATLVGGAYCGDAWTTATNVGAGEYLIKGYASNTLSSKLAVLVAGYNAADTVSAATYLRTATTAVDTSMHYKGTSSTSATVVTTTV